MPGSGSGIASDAASGDLPTLTISIANTLGTIPEHGAILDSNGLARAVDAAHGVPVSLLGVETLDGRNVGPGTVRLSGQQVVDYLSINRSFDRTDRWRAVLRGLLAGGFSLSRADAAQADSLSGMNVAIADARGALTRELPTKESQGGLLVPQNGPIRNMLMVAFKIRVPVPVPVVVLNGGSLGSDATGGQVAAPIAKAVLQAALGG